MQTCQLIVMVSLNQLFEAMLALLLVIGGKWLLQRQRSASTYVQSKFTRSNLERKHGVALFSQRGRASWLFEFPPSEPSGGGG
jgi:hypothetical protein